MPCQRKYHLHPAWRRTYPAVNLVLLDLALGLHHEQGMVEEEDLQLGAVSLLLERTLIDELAPLLLEPEILPHTMRGDKTDG